MVMMVEKVEVSGKKLGWDENVKKKKKKNFCVPSRNFAFPRKTFAFSCKTICIPLQNFCVLSQN